MELKSTNRFNLDLKEYKQEAEFIHILGKKINHIKRAENLHEISGLVAIRKTTTHYRIK